MSEGKDNSAIEFLMAGDPAIRWQTMRDLLGASASEWQTERTRIVAEGWGSQFLSHQNAEGGWPRERWTDTVWTMTLLVELGLEPQGEKTEAGFEKAVGWLVPKGETATRERLTRRIDLCHLGFYVRIGSRFSPDDDRLPAMIDTILSLQLADGGWNCRIRMKPKTSHGSFHTTFNILEGLREAAFAGVMQRGKFEEAEARALEFMLQHWLYRSDRTGEIVNERFLDLSYPSYWHYTVLRSLDYISQTPFIKDERLFDPLTWLESRRKPSGRWPVEKRIPGVTLFDMEKMGQDSRWNTLRALRVLNAAGRVN